MLVYEVSVCLTCSSYIGVSYEVEEVGLRIDVDCNFELRHCCNCGGFQGYLG
jgi:hypothetical protein